MLAQREITALAVCAFHAGDQRRTAYGIAGFDTGNTFTDFYDISAEFMAEYDRIKVCPMMQDTRNIASADAGGAYMYFDLSFAAHGCFPVGISQVLIAE